MLYRLLWLQTTHLPLLKQTYVVVYHLRINVTPMSVLLRPFFCRAFSSMVGLIGRKEFKIGCSCPLSKMREFDTICCHWNRLTEVVGLLLILLLLLLLLRVFGKLLVFFCRAFVSTLNCRKCCEWSSRGATRKWRNRNRLFSSRRFTRCRSFNSFVLIRRQRLYRRFCWLLPAISATLPDVRCAYDVH